MKKNLLKYATLLALGTALISGTNTFLTKIAVTVIKDPIVFTTLKNAVVAVLLIGVLSILNTNNEIGSGFGPYAVGILVFSIGLSLGGPTGYAINPARDLAPRFAHALLPISGKGNSDWGYAWIPVLGPIIGGVVGALLYNSLFTDLPALATP